MHAHSIRNSRLTKFVHTGRGDNFALSTNFFVTRMPTRDLFVAANLLVSDITKGCRDFYKLLQETRCGFASATFYRRVTEHPHNSVIPYWGPGLVSSLKALGRNNSVKALRKKFKTLLPRKDPRDLRQRLTNSYMLMPHGSSIGVNQPTEFFLSSWWDLLIFATSLSELTS